MDRTYKKSVCRPDSRHIAGTPRHANHTNHRGLRKRMDRIDRRRLNRLTKEL